jgi:hypothetical protein
MALKNFGFWSILGFQIRDAQPVLESTGSVEREEEESALGWGRGPS